MIASVSASQSYILNENYFIKMNFINFIYKYKIIKYKYKKFRKKKIIYLQLFSWWCEYRLNSSEMEIEGDLVSFRSLIFLLFFLWTGSSACVAQLLYLCQGDDQLKWVLRLHDLAMLWCYFAEFDCHVHVNKTFKSISTKDT